MTETQEDTKSSLDGVLQGSQKPQVRDHSVCASVDAKAWELCTPVIVPPPDQLSHASKCDGTHSESTHAGSGPRCSAAMKLTACSTSS